ncbi:MAG: DNA-processing protein DprA [Dehalococcoidia bacterium]
MSEIAYWVAFNLIPGLGRVRFGQLLDQFGSLEKAWDAGPEELIEAGISDALVRRIVERRSSIEPQAELRRLDESDIRVLNIDDGSYPESLKHIYDPPPLLYVKGSLLTDEDCPLAVVGTRKATMYGKEATERLVRDLVRNGVVIVSGLARGIDTVAHQVALSEGGRTIAVLACGLDIIYPPENAKLAQKIAENGALISEYPPGVKPRAENFPRRNRIMSGISLGTLVIEATERSGALITARMALEQDREVFAVPGNIFAASSKGSNRLIRDGAKLVLDVEDVLEELNLSMMPRQMAFSGITPETQTEELLLRHLCMGPVHIDELCRSAGLPASAVSSTLTMMELKGMVSQLGNMNYIVSQGVDTK